MSGALAVQSGDARAEDLSSFAEDDGIVEAAQADRFQVRTLPGPRSSLLAYSQPRLRLRKCLGLDPTCIGGGLQADLGGFNLGLSVFPLVVIPIPSLNASVRIFGRPRSGSESGVYGYVGGSLTMIFFPVFSYGAGVGWESRFGKKRKLVMQKQFGLAMMQAPSGTSMDFSLLLPFPVPTASVAFMRR